MEKWLKKSYPLIMLALLFVQAIISPLTVWAQTTLGENKSIVNLKELSQEDTFEIDGKHLISLTLDYENTQESTVFVGIQTNEKMTVNKIEIIMGLQQVFVRRTRYNLQYHQRQ